MTLYAIQCSFCNRENAPGAHYCSECGSPLHLRICPNADCGKVSAAEAEQCPHCGTYLPPMRTAITSTAKVTTPLAATALPTDSPLASGENLCRPSFVLLLLVAFFCFLLGTSLTLLWCNEMALRAPTTSPLPAVTAPR